MAQPLRERRAATVITPHDREFARIAGVEPGSDRVEAALRLAAQMNAVVEKLTLDEMIDVVAYVSSQYP